MRIIKEPAVYSAGSSLGIIERNKWNYCLTAALTQMTVLAAKIKTRTEQIVDTGTAAVAQR